MKSVVLLVLVVASIGARGVAQVTDGSAEISIPQRLESSEKETERWRILTGDVFDRREGGVKLTGVPMFHAAAFERVDWTISGSNVSGVAKGPDDRPLAWFAGKLVDGKLHGTFTTAYGQIGGWEWEGPLPDDLAGGDH